MLIEVLKRTPPWVFALFFVLLGLGLAYSRARRVSPGRAVAVPVVLFFFSVFGVLSAFRASPAALLAWVAAFLTAGSATRLLGYPRGVTFDRETRRLSIPGSWAPLALYMTLYFTKYGVAVALARNAGLAASPSFSVPVGAIYGCFSGVFFAASVSLWSAAWRGRTPSSADEGPPVGK